MNRRDFFVRISGAALAVPAALQLGGCGLFDDDDPVDTPDANNQPDAPPAVCANGTNVTIGPPEEPHVMVVTMADVQAGVEKTYDIQGQTAHNHEVTLTAAHFEMLAAGETVTVVSTPGAAHTHDITVVCA